jgi:TldD protein
VDKAMEDEMARSLSSLHVGTSPPPYYVRYTITDTDHSYVSARLGSLVDKQRSQGRNARVDVRVGSAAEDNTNFREYRGGTTAGISEEDDYAAVRRDLWLLTDHEYKQALETWARKKASHAIEAGAKDKVADFSPAAPVTSTVSHASAVTDGDRAQLEALVLSLSRVFRDYPSVNGGSAHASVTETRRRLLTSERASAEERWSEVMVDVYADTIAEDGARLASSIHFAAPGVAGLPSADKMAAEIRALARNLTDQRTAPAVEPGSATVLFEARAAAQLARLLFAGPLSGQPVPRSAGESPRDGSASLADKLGLRVAPPWLTVTDDPSALGPGKRPLFGSYRIDDEGVIAEPVKLIESGVLKTLLMSRTPRKEIAHSNGHGRGAEGPIRGAAASLFVTAQGGLRREDLLSAAARSAGPNGTVYVVRELGESSGLGRGQTLEARVALQYKDGKETVVRGLSLEGFTPKKLKKDLIGAGRELVVMDEGASVPTSVVTPALLFEDVDVGKPSDKNRRPPLYASPLASGLH